MCEQENDAAYGHKRVENVMETGCRGGVGVGDGLKDSGEIGFCRSHENHEEEEKERITLLEVVGGHGSQELQVDMSSCW